MQSYMRTMASHLAAAALLLLILSAAVPLAHGQAASAPAPSPAPPKTITAVLSKAGQFTKFLQLLQSTREAEQITNQLKGKSSSSGGGLTVFAPPDSAFSALPAGTLNALSDQQKTSLVQFHVVSAALPAAQLETVSNPLRTQAGDTGKGKYPLNLTADGSNVNVSTGVVNATLDATPLYAGDRLVVYQVSKVLLPRALYGPPVPPAPAPAPAEGKKKKKKAAATDAVADAPVGETTAAGNATASAAAARGTPAGGVGAAASCVAVAVAMATIWWGM